MKTLFLILPFLISCTTVKTVQSSGGMTDKGAKIAICTPAQQVTVTPEKKTNPASYYCKEAKIRIRKPGDITKYNY
jgi:hypothetical protein